VSREIWDPNGTNLVRPPQSLIDDGYQFESIPFSEHINWVLNISTAGNGNNMPVGSIITTVGPAVPDVSGWVGLTILGTIGSSASTATLRANNDTQALFEYIWNHIADVYCPVIGGRGATAAADFVANKPITLPNTPGRAIACAGGGGPHGHTTGAGTATLSIANLAAHTHTQTAHSHPITMDPHDHPLIADLIAGGSGVNYQNYKPNRLLAIGGTAGFFETAGFQIGEPVIPGEEFLRKTTTTGTASSGGGGNTGSTGSGAPFSIEQPTIFLNHWIKL